MAQESAHDVGTVRQHLLVLRCQTGDERAFADLYRQFSGRTLRYLQGLIGAAAADDVQQEVWLSVYRKVASLANPRGVRTWLYQTTRNRAIDFLRKQRRQAELIKAAGEEAAAVAAHTTGQALPAPGSPDLEAAMARLSPAHRDVLILRYWEEMSYAEIALVVGCSVGTVRSRIHHAKQNVRTALEES
jgi:RNA polymerase sigma-70 factor (ECF subfamily)